MSDIQKLIAERIKIDKEQRELNDKALAEKRGFTAEEQEKWDKLDKRFNELSDDIDKAQQAEQDRLSRQGELEKRNKMLKQSQRGPTKPDPTQDDDKRQKEAKTTPIEYRGNEIITKHQKRWAEAAKIPMPNTGRPLNDAMKLFNFYLKEGGRMLSNEQIRALQADDDKAGGYTVAPEQFMARLIQDKDRRVFLRPFATIIPIGQAASIAFPELEDDPADADWTAEIKTGSEDSTMDFNKRVLYPHPCAKRIKISRTLARISSVNIEALVRERLAYKFGITEEQAFISGSGVNEPLGVMTQSDAGISSARDVSTGNTSTSVKFDGLMEVVGNMEEQYLTNCRWIFHRNGMTKIRKLKDGEGRYIWEPRTTVNRPDLLLGYPIHASEYMNNTWSASQLVGIFGDFSYYWIVDALTYSVQVLNELYAETNQIGYIGRQEVDGAPVHEKAFTRVKLSS